MAISVSIQIALYMAVGLFARKKGIVRPEFEQSLGRFLVDFCLPCMIVQSLRSSAELTQLYQYGVLLLLSLLVLAVCGLAGQICCWLAGGGSRGRVYRFGLLISNFTFMGLPAAELLLGKAGVFPFSVFTIPIRLIYYSTVELLMSPQKSGRLSRDAWKRVLLSPPIWGVVAGVLIAGLGIEFPAPIEAVLAGLAAVCSPMGMVLCGLTIGGADLHKVKASRYLLLPLLRVLVMPAIIFAVVWALPLDPLFKQVAVLYAALPCAGMMTTYAVRYDPDPEAREMSAACTLLSSLLAMVTLPLWGALLVYL